MRERDRRIPLDNRKNLVACPCGCGARIPLETPEDSRHLIFVRNFRRMVICPARVNRIMGWHA